MANYSIFINPIKRALEKRRQQRRYRQGLIYFFEALSLYLKAGFSLPHSWPETLTALRGAIPEQLQKDLSFRLKESGHQEGVSDVLSRLKKEGSVASHKMWFGVLEELYESGAGLTQCIEAVATTLRRDQDRELEAHCRSLPVKANVILILFFLPPTFLWIFAPLLLEILTQFK